MVVAYDAAEHYSFLKNLALDLVTEDEAEDVVQDAMASLLMAPPKQDTKVRAWLSIVVLNRARSVARSRKRRLCNEARAAREGDSHTSAVESIDVEQACMTLLSTLCEEQRMVLRMRYCEGISLGQIAKRLGRSRQAVQRYHAATLAQLRRSLDAKTTRDSGHWPGAELIGLLSEVGDSWSGLCPPRKRLSTWVFSDEQLRCSSSVTGAERHLLEAHRQALAELLLQASRTAYWKAPGMGIWTPSPLGAFKPIVTEAELHSLVEIQSSCQAPEPPASG